MKTTVHIITLLMLCCTCSVAPAQPAIHFNRLTKADGLSSDVVYDMHQDRNGFLWIATHGGLDRYDGYRFKHYRYNPDDSNSLSGNYVHCIKEDKNGLLWITNNNGLNSLDPETGIIKRFVPSPAMMPKDMHDIMVVNDSILLITAIFTAYVFNKNQQSFSEIKIPAVEDGRLYTDRKFITDGKGTILLPFLYIDQKRWNLLSINWQHNKAELPKDWQNRLPNLYFDKKGNTWAFDSSLINLKISGIVVSYPYSNKDPGDLENMITDFFEDENRMWFCTGSGLVYYDYQQNKFYRCREEPGNAASLSNNRVQCMLKDKNGLYWVGTFGGGVCYFSGNTLLKNITIDTSYSSADRKFVGLQALHSGRIIVKTMGGNYFMLEKDKSLHELDYAKDFKTPVPLDDLIRELTGRAVQEISAKDFIVLRNYFNVGKSPKYFVSAKQLKYALETFGYLLPYYDKIWIRSGGGRKALYDGTVHPYKQQVNSMLPIANNHFLFATGNGLIEFNASKDSVIKTWLHKPGNTNSIGSNWITYIAHAGKGNYWVGTADAGFDHWDVKADKFYHYTTMDGLPDNKIYTILPDKHGRLWMSTDNGLSCFDTLSKSFTNYSKYDGLINTEYNSGTACVDIDGWFYFGGMNGIDYFHPDSIDKQRPVPVLHLASFRVYDKEKPLNNSHKLATNDNNIQLEFTANDFANASKLLFRYKLSGVDEKWVSMRGDNIALYSKLPYGKYRFGVKGSYDGRAWSKPLVIDFTIATPWFQSWWFYSLLALAATAAIYFLFNYRLQQRLKLYSMRNRISRDLHDDVGATLSSVKAYSSMLKDNPDNPLIAELIEENAGEMIERLEVIAWATNPHHDSFESLYNKLHRYATPLCLAKKIAFEFRTDGIGKETVMPGEVRQNIFLIAKESVNNSIKYAEPKNIIIDTNIQSGKFLLHITDDGKGFDTTQDDDGNGLKNMQSRIKDIGGNISIISESGKGTEITIQLAYPFRYPKQHNHQGG